MSVIAPIHLHRMHSVGDGYKGRVHIIRQHAVICPGAQLIASTAAAELDEQDDFIGSVMALQDVSIISGGHSDGVGIEIEARAVMLLSIRGVIPHIHRGGIVDYRLQTIAPDQSRIWTHAQVAAIRTAGGPG